MGKIQEYHLNYASLKARGTSEPVYIFTMHKNPVKKAGFESVSSLKTTYNATITRFEGGNDNVTRFENSIVRSKNTVIQLVANNQWDYFVTLTISPDSDADRYNLSDAKSKILKFLNNYKVRKSPDLKYLLIPEFHQNGAVHFHGVFKGIRREDLKINKNGYFDFVPYCERFGFCSLGEISDLRKCACYITKYLNKDMFLNREMENGVHLYFASKGLKKDKLIRVGSSNYAVEDFVKMHKQVYENDFCCKVETNDLLEGEAFITPFAKQFKCGVNVRATPLNASEKLKLKRIAVKRYKNFMGIDLSEFSLDNLWNQIMSEFCCGVTEYEMLKMKYDLLKEQLKPSWSVEKLTEDEFVRQVEGIFNVALNSSPDGLPFVDDDTYKQIELGVV